MVDRGQRVATLITAESIIVGFLVAFGLGVNQTLVSWIETGKPIFGTVFAGLLISLLALTAFRSMLLLYQSIDISDVDGAMLSDERYRVGYDLFLMVIALTGFYVLTNAFSILHYAVAHENYAVVGLQSEPRIIIVTGIIFFACGGFSVFLPFEFTKLARCIRNKLSTYLLPIAAGWTVVATILFAMVWLQAIPSLLFFLSTIPELGMIWMLMMPRNAKDDPE